MHGYTFHTNTWFIPAPAGNMPPAGRRGNQHAVHPRACGEHLIGSAWASNSAGSSPRLRGTLMHGYTFHTNTWFIPAPAGNMPPAGRRGNQHAVHPRACGEHLIGSAWASNSAGSSPRLRGTSVVFGAELDICRFIPAPAGNIDPDNINIFPPSVHPRACGEHASASAAFLILNGSSPRLRGTYPSLTSARHGVRFIPAPAGNILIPLPPWTMGPVHPRACGEHYRPAIRPCTSFGSSPRLRGTWSQRHR